MNLNRPGPYSLPPHDGEAHLQRLNAGLRDAIAEGIESGPSISSEDVFAEVKARYAEPKSVQPTGTRRRA